MPVETIKCRECGSAEVAEFKPGSYVCGHCEAIFKHIDPAAAAGLTPCAEADCGVDSIAICLGCGRRYCNQHYVVRVEDFHEGSPPRMFDLYPQALVHPQGQTVWKRALLV